MNDEKKVEDLLKRLEKENEILNATRNIRKIQQSDAARASCDATIEECQQRIDYFQNEVNRLLSRLMDNPPGSTTGGAPVKSTSSGGQSTSGQSEVGGHPELSHSRQASVSSVNASSENTVANIKPLSTVGKHWGRSLTRAIMRFLFFIFFFVFLGCNLYQWNEHAIYIQTQEGL
jgi:classical protein kinase C